MVEQTVNVDPDGSTTFEGAEGATDGAEGGTFEETMEEVVEAGIDPAIYLLVAFIVGSLLYFLYVRKSRSDEDDYFSSYEKVSIVWKKVIGTETSIFEMDLVLEDCHLLYRNSSKPDYWSHVKNIFGSSYHFVLIDKIYSTI